MQTLMAKQLLKVAIPVVIGSIATYLATAHPAVYQALCTAVQ